MLKNEYAESGKTKEELDDLLFEEEQKFRSEYGIGAFATNTTVGNSKSEDNVSSSFSGKSKLCILLVLTKLQKILHMLSNRGVV